MAGLMTKLALRLGSRLVPAMHRRQWRDEWLAELAVARDAAGREPWHLLPGIVADAVAARRYGGSPRVTGQDARHPRRERMRGAAALGRDLRHGVRALARDRGFAVVAALTLALGIGLTTAMFSAVYTVLLRPLPYEDPGRIVVLRQTDVRDGSMRSGVSAANTRDVAAAARTLEHVSGAAVHGFTLMEDGRAHSLRGWQVTAGFFDVFGTRALLGRTFVREEFEAGSEHVVLLGHRTWVTRYGGRRDVIGSEMTLDGIGHRVVGVLPPEFRYPFAAEIWTPRAPRPWDAAVRAGAQLDAVARLAPDVTHAQAEAELGRIAAELAVVHPAANGSTGFALVPLTTHLFRPVQTGLLLLLGAGGLVLLISAVNVAGLQLARASAHVREHAVRRALGATTRDTVRQVVVEALVLGAVGCVGGVVIAALGVDFIRTLAPRDVPRIDELRIDRVVLAFALFASVLSALAAAAAPALAAARSAAPGALLADGSRGNTAGLASRRVRNRLVVAEIALAIVLTVSAGLLVRSYEGLLASDAGFDAERRLAVQVFAYDDADEPDLTFVRHVIQEIGARPGVVAVGLTTSLPMADNESIWAMRGVTRFVVEGGPDLMRELEARVIGIDTGYAAAMGVPLVAGRAFSDHDHALAPPVAMVNRAFVRQFLSARDTVGARLVMAGASRSREIVGVLGDVRASGPGSDVVPEIYVPYFQAPSTGGITLVVRTAADPESMMSSVQEAVWRTKPGQSIWAARSLTSLLNDWTRERRFATSLLLAFTVCSLCLAAIGVYGLLSFTVAQRRNELGVRRALGAGRTRILGAVLRTGLGLALMGASFGVAAAAVFTRLLRGMLFDVQPLDPLTFAATVLFVVGVALAASLQPAWRATQIEPMSVIRAD